MSTAHRASYIKSPCEISVAAETAPADFCRRPAWQQNSASGCYVTPQNYQPGMASSCSTLPIAPSLPANRISVLHDTLSGRFALPILSLSRLWLPLRTALLHV